MYDFGLSDAQFWDLTPAQFNALSRRFDADQERQDHHTARLMWAAFVVMGGKKKDDSPFTVDDFRLTYDDAFEDEGADPSDKILTTMTNIFGGLPPHMEWMSRGR